MLSHTKWPNSHKDEHQTARGWEREASMMANLDTFQSKEKFSKRKKKSNLKIPRLGTNFV